MNKHTRAELRKVLAVRIQAGEVLTVPELARQYKFKPDVVRLALAELIQQGIAEMRAKRASTGLTGTRPAEYAIASGYVAPTPEAPEPVKVRTGTNPFDVENFDYDGFRASLGVAPLMDFSRSHLTTSAAALAPKRIHFYSKA